MSCPLDFPKLLAFRKEFHRLPESRFDYSSLISDSYNEYTAHCPRCIGGWAAFLFGPPDRGAYRTVLEAILNTFLTKFYGPCYNETIYIFDELVYGHEGISFQEAKECLDLSIQALAQLYNYQLPEGWNS